MRFAGISAAVRFFRSRHDLAIPVSVRMRGTYQAFGRITDQVKSACDGERFAHAGAVLRASVLKKRALKHLFPRVRDMHLLTRKRINPGIIHDRGCAARRRIEILNLLG